ncbi:MAG: hypothetical protein KDA53_00080 [Hyphomonas sp.]|nr:hypothetical protein [Hyphomonas sp.]
MQRQFSTITMALVASFAAALPATADELKDAIECEQFVAMSARQIPAGHESEAEAKALKNAWTTHVRLLSGDAETLNDERTAMSQAIFHVIYTGDAAAKQALLSSAQRCKTAPMIETSVYPVTTCAAFAKYSQEPAESTVSHHEAKALGFRARGNEEQAAVAQALAEKARERARLSSRIRHAFFTAQPNARVEPNHFGIFGEGGEPLLNSCVASMGLDVE